MAETRGQVKKGNLEISACVFWSEGGVNRVVLCVSKQLPEEYV